MNILEKTEYWDRILQDWRDSGCSQKDFCQQREISYSTFQYWRRKGKDCGKDPILNETLHAVEIGTTLRSTRSSVAMEFESNGILIKIAETDATVTIRGRINLERLEKIISACGSFGKEL